MSNALQGGNSIPAQVYVPQQQNPFQQVDQIAQTQNALLGLQSNRMQMQAKQAYGQAIAASTDPNTGVTDQNKLMGALSQDPRAAWMLPQIQQQNLANTKAQLENSGLTLDQAIKRNTYAATQLSSLLNKPDVSPTDVISLAANMINTPEHAFSKDDATNEISGLPMQGGPALKQWLQQKLMTTLSGQERLNALAGTATTVDNGAQKIPGVQASPMNGGGFTPNGTPITNQLSPSEATSPTQIGTTPAGAPVMGTRQQFVGQTGGGFGDGRYSSVPASLRNPAAQSATSPGVVTGLGPGQSATLSANATAGAAQGNALGAAASESQNRLSSLSQLEQESGGFSGGVGAGTTLGLKSAYNRFAPSIAQYDTKGVADQEAFNKTAQMIINQQSQALGAGSDARLDAAAHANLNENISNAGVHEILPVLKGNELAIQARNQAWQATRDQNPTADYNQWSAQFNQTFDPRLYQAQFMTPQQRQAMVSNLKGPDRAHFAAALRANPDLMPSANQPAASNEPVTPVNAPLTFGPGGA